MKTFVLLAALMALVASVAAEDLKCWDCSSEDDGEGDCLDADKLADHKDWKVTCKGDNAACAKIWQMKREKVGEEDKEVVHRLCIKDTTAGLEAQSFLVEPTNECHYGTGFNPSEAYSCLCTDNECNGSETLGASLLAVFGVVTLGLLARH